MPKIICNISSQKLLVLVYAVFFMCMLPSIAKASSHERHVGEDKCLAKWTAKLGILSEVKPGRLMGLREVRLQDGNVVFIDKTCEHIVIGEVMSLVEPVRRLDPVRTPVDFSSVDFSRLMSLGPARSGTSWIFVIHSMDLASLKLLLEATPSWDKRGYYIAFVSGSRTDDFVSDCHFNRASLISGGKLSACMAHATWDDALGFSGPFAISPSGERIDFSWASGLPKVGK